MKSINEIIFERRFARITAASRHHVIPLSEPRKLTVLNSTHAHKMRGLFENVEMNMNGKQAAKLKIGDRVRYTGTCESAEDACPGTVIEANWHAVKIKYDDGVIQILHHDDAADIERLDERYDVTIPVDA